MNNFKTSEKVTIWMKRNGLTQQNVAVKLGITRQTLIIRLKANNFKAEEMNTLKTMGYSE